MLLLFCDSGGMQDYNYLHGNCLEVTMELSCCKYPQASQLQKEWDMNRESLLAYMEKVGSGLGLTLTHMCIMYMYKHLCADYSKLTSSQCKLHIFACFDRTSCEKTWLMSNPYLLLYLNSRTLWISFSSKLN